MYFKHLRSGRLRCNKISFAYVKKYYISNRWRITNGIRSKSLGLAHSKQNLKLYKTVDFVFWYKVFFSSQNLKYKYSLNLQTALEWLPDYWMVWYRWHYFQNIVIENQKWIWLVLYRTWMRVALKFNCMNSLSAHFQIDYL